MNNISSTSNIAYPNSFTNCTVEYNIGTTASQFVSGMNGTGTTYGMGNQTKTLAQIAFVSSSSNDGTYQLQGSSVAIGAGKDAVAGGVFAGDFVYN